jgi:alpha-ketoglutarate-dependent taurine dioxygenase
MKPTADDPGPNKTTPTLLSDTTDNVRAWKREHLSPADWMVPLPAACLEELHEVARFVQTHPQPVQHLSPTMFTLTACAEMIATLRQMLTHQDGFAVLDRIPVERYSLTESRAIFWLLASILGQVVRQKWNDETVLYDVKDSGKTLGYGVRRSVTNVEQDLHTDGGWLGLPPEFVGLFCLQPAQAGGMSRCASLITVHHEMRRHYPDLLPRLYQPFWWDRQAEHRPDGAKCSWYPVYWRDGHTLLSRYYEDYIHNGYKLMAETLDETGAEALATMRTIIDAPENRVEFHLDRGQILYLNNRQCAHARTAFTDAAAPQTRRHLIRLWNRSEGTVHLEGQEE